MPSSQNKPGGNKNKMDKKTFHILEVLGGVVFGALIVISIYTFLPENLKAALPVLHRAPEEADIAVIDVNLRKVEGVSHPSYSRYTADVTVKNLGRFLSDASLTLSSGGGRKDVSVSTQKQNFTLGYNDEVVLKDYSVFIDKNYNGEMITFQVALDSYEDANLENNVFQKGIVDFENDGLGDVFITGVAGSRIGLTLPVNLGEDFNYYLLHSFRIDSFPGKEFMYREFAFDGNVLSYYTGLSEMGDLEVLRTFDEIAIDPLNPAVSFSSDVYKDMSSHIFVLKAVKKDRTVYSFSNFVVLPAQNFMNKAEFAKILVEELGIQPYTDGNPYFVDLEEDVWFSPYVKTLLNRGIIKPEKTYNPADFVTRAYAAEALVEAFGLKFKLAGGAPHFADIPRENPSFYAVETLYSSGRLSNFGPAFMPNNPASRSFLQFFLKQK